MSEQSNTENRIHKPLIEMRNVCAGYLDQEVLHDVSIQLHAGEITAVIGPNGCGKSTLLKTAAGLQKASKGEIYIEGDELGVLTRREAAKRVAFLAQAHGMPQMTVQKLVLHGRFPYLGYPRQYGKEDKEIVMDALEKIGIRDLAGSQVSKLSGGQRQSAYLAMALAQKTPIVLLDEPTTYLDLKHQIDIMSILRTMTEEGKAIGAVLHDLPLALRGADKVVVMEDGRILMQGTPHEIYDSGILPKVFGVEIGRTSQGQYYCII